MWKITLKDDNDLENQIVIIDGLELDDNFFKFKFEDNSVKKSRKIIINIKENTISRYYEDDFDEFIDYKNNFIKNNKTISKIVVRKEDLLYLLSENNTIKKLGLTILLNKL